MSLDTVSTLDSHYTDNSIDYEKQNPPHKIRIYVDLVERWVRRGELIFELGVGLGVFLERATERFACQGCDINRYGIEPPIRNFPEFPYLKGLTNVSPKVLLQKRSYAGIS